ncbi:MAG: polysaccharide deacetylase family protein [Anaerolineales bacterium]|nr:polysaccharide deacetylase family protein [Anaerolineales bacterium]MBX3036893.1 polysaccharide deacetylase family protein [Anaerolineales bacterium]
MKKLLLTFIFLISACDGGVTNKEAITSTPPSVSFTPVETQKNSTPVLPTQTLISNPIWIPQGPNEIVVPILLYHHITESSTHSQYYIEPKDFEEQMQLLNRWGYTTITTTMLVEAIHKGLSLPPRPIIITFDDSNLDNYNIAFPIMQKYEFTGVVYIVGRYLGAENFINAQQAKEMANAGWEIGSHSMNHVDLSTITSDERWYEIHGSREFLEQEIGVPVLTFAYPFGVYDCNIMDVTYQAGYIAGMGLGNSNDQCTYDLFALHRHAIKLEDDIETFSLFLPWQGELQSP